MILIIVIIAYIKDSREIGKENLAVPLSERLTWYLILIGLPILIAIIKYRTI